MYVTNTRGPAPRTRTKGLAPSLLTSESTQVLKRKPRRSSWKIQSQLLGNGEKLEEETEHALERGGKKVSNLPATAEIILSTLLLGNFRSKTYSEYFSGEAALDSRYKSVSRRRAKELVGARATVATVVADPGHAPTYPADKRQGRSTFSPLQQQAPPCIP